MLDIKVTRVEKYRVARERVDASARAPLGTLAAEPIRWGLQFFAVPPFPPRGFALAGFSAARCLPSCRFASALAESARPGRAALLAALVRRSSACHMTYRLV